MKAAFLAIFIPSLAFCQSTATVNIFDESRLDNLDLAVRELQSGRPTLTGIPKYLNGITFSDDVTQTASSTMAVTTNNINLGAWRTWAPAYTGFSTPPSGGFATYIQIGKMVIAVWQITSVGTSNSTLHTITGPVAAQQSQASVSGMIKCVDNGGADAYGLIESRAASAVFDLYASAASAAWTASGTSYCRGFFLYEAD